MDVKDPLLKATFDDLSAAPRPGKGKLQPDEFDVDAFNVSGVGYPLPFFLPSFVSSFLLWGDGFCCLIVAHLSPHTFMADRSSFQFATVVANDTNI